MCDVPRRRSTSSAFRRWLRNRCAIQHELRGLLVQCQTSHPERCHLAHPREVTPSLGHVCNREQRPMRCNRPILVSNDVWTATNLTSIRFGTALKTSWSRSAPCGSFRNAEAMTVRRATDEHNLLQQLAAKSKQEHNANESESPGGVRSTDGLRTACAGQALLIRFRVKRTFATICRGARLGRGMAGWCETISSRGSRLTAPEVPRDFDAHGDGCVTCRDHHRFAETACGMQLGMDSEPSSNNL
jgi:hypothetical protein